MLHGIRPFFVRADAHAGIRASFVRAHVQMHAGIRPFFVCAHVQMHAEVTDAGPEEVFRTCIREMDMQVGAGVRRGCRCVPASAPRSCAPRCRCMPK